MTQRISLILLAVYWLAMIIGTHIPVGEFPYMFSWADKVYHCLTYALLAVLIVNAFGLQESSRLGLRTIVALGVLLVLHGAVDELTQSFIPGRVPSIADWVADGLGGLMGVGVCKLWVERKKEGWSSVVGWRSSGTRKRHV